MKRTRTRRPAFLLTIASGTLGSLFSPAQTPTTNGKSISFEVVSIRREPAEVLGHDEIQVTRDGWRMERAPLMAVLTTAYVPTTPDAMMYTVSTMAGIPDWVRTEVYSVDAKVSAADLPAWHDPAQQQAMLRSMLQAMLADRCGLKVHRGTKEVAVYLLVVAKGGAKLKDAVPGERHAGTSAIPGGGEFLPNDGAGNASFYDAPVRALAVVLSNLVGRPVEDRTGLTGRYDMVFRRPRAGGPSTEPDAGPTIFDVVHDLGLKLEPSKGEVETLVVDRVERPSEN